MKADITITQAQEKVDECYKIYAESFRDEQHLGKIQDDARAAIAKVF